VDPFPSRIHVSKEVQDLAVISLVLGIVSFVCLLFTGIPAVVCGHIARRRAKAAPDRLGGEGLAVSGQILGCIGIALSFAVPFVLLPAIGVTKGQKQTNRCQNNLKIIGYGLKQWAVDNNDLFPWEVSVTNGGTMELAVHGGDNIDRNPIHFEILSNELEKPYVLVCPGDSKHTAAFRFRNLNANNISYELHSGSNVSGLNPDQILLVCPIHGNVLTCDGSVYRDKLSRKNLY
jgi:hypothetical protein